MRRASTQVTLLMGLLTMFPTISTAQERNQGRSMVISRAGIVSAEHPLAAQAGAQILAQGGSAVDAAIATNAVMGVVAPMSNGMGGDLFAIVYNAKEGKLYGLNASGWAPAGLTLELLKSKGITSMPQRGIYSVTVPGVVAGWDKLRERFGRKSWNELLTSATYYADEGFPVTEMVAGRWAASETVLRRDPAAAKVYLPGGKAPRVGDVFRNGDLAWAFKQIAAQGADAFYRGEIAKRILASANAHGAPWTPADLAEFSPEWVEPISTTYRGWTVYEMPPNGQGIAALIMLNLMEQYPIKDYGHNSAKALHAMIEAKKLAYADMLRYVADPRVSKVPVSGMLSKEYAKQRAAKIDPAKANCAVPAGQPPAPGDDTIYLSVVDADGNMVSLIQSNYELFGSGLVAEGTGFALQDRGGLFSLDPNSPNVIAGRKRPLHTIIPAFMEKGDVRIAFGIMGGWNQSQAHAQYVSNIVDHGMNIQAAMEAARFTKGTFEGCDVRMESRVPAEVRAELEKLGHKIQLFPGVFNEGVGGGQAVLRDFATKVNYGASDPRKDGGSYPQPPAEKKN